MPVPIDPNHPRPQLQRPGWFSLDGPWEFALDRERKFERPADVVFDATIVVPFAPETAASGIAAAGFVRRCWYRREVTLPDRPAADRWRLHFGAVDRIATVWIDGALAARHEGGYTPFSVDLPRSPSPASDVGGPRPIEIVVRADDDPATMDVPRGKQDWLEEPHAIWYPRTTGIWQTVWCEPIPPASVSALRWRGDPTTMSVDLEIDLEGDVAPGSRVAVELSFAGRILASDVLGCTAPVEDGPARLRRTIGIDTGDVAEAVSLVWRPHHPALIDAHIRLLDTNGDTRDDVASYTAIRSAGVEKGRFVLNGRPRVLRLALDQGYWSESGYTAPSVDALRADVELALAMGFNGVRKHQKVEDPRWLHWCDRLGLLVWEEMPSAYSFSDRTVAAVTAEWAEVVRRDRNHPSIVAWVPFNESWGVPDPVHDASQRAAIAALANLTRALDPTRPISANDGWETVGGDIVGIHDYDQDAARVRARYATWADVDALFDGHGPARRRLTADGSGRAGRAVVLSELGGLTLAPSADGLFSYGNTTTADELLARFRALCEAVLASDALSGFCWTQLVDTYQEANGLARMDRTPKVPLADLRAATTGR